MMDMLPLVKGLKKLEEGPDEWSGYDWVPWSTLRSVLDAKAVRASRNAPLPGFFLSNIAMRVPPVGWSDRINLWLYQKMADYPLKPLI